MNSETLSIITSLQSRLKQLVRDYNDVREKKLALEEKNNVLQENLNHLNEEFNHFQNQEKIVKIVNSVVREEEKGEKGKELKRSINGYIKEIDKCINLLSQES